MRLRRHAGGAPVKKSIAFRFTLVLQPVIFTGADAYRPAGAHKQAMARQVGKSGARSKTGCTLTADNGTEFAGHAAVSDALQAGFYFAHPSASWERGTNENTHGLIRQYFPKSYDLSTSTCFFSKKVLTWEKMSLP